MTSKNHLPTIALLTGIMISGTASAQWWGAWSDTDEIAPEWGLQSQETKQPATNTRAKDVAPAVISGSFGNAKALTKTDAKSEFVTEVAEVAITTPQVASQVIPPVVTQAITAPETKPATRTARDDRRDRRTAYRDNREQRRDDRHTERRDRRRYDPGYPSAPTYDRYEGSYDRYESYYPEQRRPSNGYRSRSGEYRRYTKRPPRRYSKRRSSSYGPMPMPMPFSSGGMPMPNDMPMMPTDPSSYWGGGNWGDWGNWGGSNSNRGRRYRYR